MDLTPWLDLLRPTFEGKRVIIALQHAAAAEADVRQVLKLGATEVLVVAARSGGLGADPADHGARVVTLGIDHDGTAGGSIQAVQRALASLPEWVCVELDRFDSDRNAVVLGDFLNENSSLGGRPFVFHRRPEWLALDEKTEVDSLWDAVGIARAPSVIVDATLKAVANAFVEVDRSDGVVVAVDSSTGWTGGGEGTRWIRDRNPDSIGEALGTWLQPGRRVRVMPFLEGTPCSIHGIVFDDYVVALRPVEMVVLRKVEGGFFYAGCASFYDPPDGDREEMRGLGKKVGAFLRERVGYRGAFTVDGVMTTEGFRPTELNPRNGAGLMAMERAYGQPLHLLVDFVASGMKADWRPAQLEMSLLAAFDARRGGGTWGTAPVVSESVPASGRVRFGDSSVELAEESEPADLVFSSAISANGTFIRALWQQDRISLGPSTAPLAAKFWNWVDSTYSLGIGEVSAARSVR